ncbi:type III effector protein [Streptomyces sp. ME109]|uniref:type III effector protein n=1 Tax=Streptomyces sp. me109 TaxID=1827853 RepID=UPI0021C7E2B5|nr:type III effector protein [Streptomyces sp. me109]
MKKPSRRATFAELKAAFPDLEHDLHHVHHTPTAVILEAQARGKQHADWRGIPNRGKSIDAPVAVYELARWEPGLIEAARAAGSSWADLAHPLGVASRQAAERRYLRVRPTPGTTGEQRVQATRNRRAADRTTTWARANAAELRQLAGQVSALTDLPARARTPLARLANALADSDAAHLIDPLADTHTHLEATHPDLAARIAAITHHADQLRQAGEDHH